MPREEDTPEVNTIYKKDHDDREGKNVKIVARIDAWGPKGENLYKPVFQLGGRGPLPSFGRMGR